MLSDESRRVVDAANAQPEPALARLDAAGDRAYAAALRERFRVAAPAPDPTAPRVRIDDVELDGVAAGRSARIYRPPGLDERGAAVVFCHGGGWVAGSPRDYDGFCRALAAAARSLVVSVAYRLAPEHPFPAAAEDAFAALAWTHANARRLGVDPAGISVAGISAGGNLAAAAALRARDEGGPPLRRQVLIYPVLDGAMALDSHRRNGTGFVTTHEQIAWFWRQYAPRADDRRHPYASPLRAGDLAGLPPALVIAAEHDPLRDEAEAYAAALRSAGGAATFVECPGEIHGFVSLFPEAPVVAGVVRDVAAEVAATGNR